MKKIELENNEYLEITCSSGNKYIVVESMRADFIQDLKKIKIPKELWKRKPIIIIEN